MGQKINWFKEWIYPILAPLIVTVVTIAIIMPIFIPSSPILDIVIRDYYKVESSIEPSLEFVLKNTQTFKITIYSVGYIFSWEDHVPKGMKYVPLPVPKITDNQSTKDEYIILNPAGQENDSLIKKLKIKTPAEGTHSLEIIVDTDRGIITKKITLFVEEDN